MKPYCKTTARPTLMPMIRLLVVRGVQEAEDDMRAASEDELEEASQEPATQDGKICIEVLYCELHIDTYTAHGTPAIGNISL